MDKWENTQVWQNVQIWKNKVKELCAQYNMKDATENSFSPEQCEDYTPDEFVLAFYITGKYNGGDCFFIDKTKKYLSNYEYLQLTDKCGCYHCLKEFNPNEIEYDGNNLCPYCGIDSIMPDNEEYPLTNELLKLLRKVMFGDYNNPDKIKNEIYIRAWKSRVKELCEQYNIQDVSEDKTIYHRLRLSPEEYIEKYDLLFYVEKNGYNIKTDKCSCYYCFKTFATQDIKEVGACPHCGLNAIVPHSEKYPPTIEALQFLHKLWFN